MVHGSRTEINSEDIFRPGWACVVEVAAEEEWGLVSIYGRPSFCPFCGVKLS